MRSEERGTRNEKPRAGAAAGLGRISAAVLMLIVALSLGVAQSAQAQARVVPGKSTTVGTPETESVAREAMTRLRSPVTPSHTLDMCPNVGVEALRDTIRMAAAEGQSVDQIVEGVIGRYGDFMRIVPERRGVGLWAWVMPPVVLLLGAGLLMARLRRMRGEPLARSEPVDDDDGLSDEDRQRIEAALAELEVSQEEPA
jgi:cytochrome c-type biogenesis protein CcmH/NrfF